MPTWVSSPVHRDLIRALVEARIKAGLTQRDLAYRLGKPPSFVGKVESIERNLSVLEFLAWTRAVGVSTDAVLANIDLSHAMEI